MLTRSNWTIYGTLWVSLAAACAVSLFTGAVQVPPAEMFHSGIIQLRIARTLMALVVGAGLSVSGVIFQALFRNPLAEPYILGVSSGAGLGAVMAISLNLSFSGTWTLPVMAFVGGLATILLVGILARDRSGATPAHTLLLSGVMVNAVFASLLMFLVSVSSSENLHSVIWWLLGSCQVLDWSLLQAAAVVVCMGLSVTVWLSRDLNVMTLGEEAATHLGLDVENTRKIFLFLASLMTGATVAACGLIGFVGLLVPHSVRLAIGPDHRRLVPATALAGGTFLVLADNVSRTAMAPTEIPIGVVTALLGGPFFFFLLRRRKRSIWG